MEAVGIVIGTLILVALFKSQDYDKNRIWDYNPNKGCYVKLLPSQKDIRRG